jgi:hypothetical protein
MSDQVLIGNWNELAEYKAMGMTVEYVEGEEGAETFMVAQIPEAVRELMVQRMKAQGRAPRPRSLGETVRMLARQAREQAGEAQRVTLHGGLGLDVLLDGETWRVQVWREGAEPSVEDWNQVVVCWTGESAQGVAVVGRRLKVGRRGYLGGEWTAPKTSPRPSPRGGEGAEETPAVTSGGEGAELEK